MEENNAVSFMRLLSDESTHSTLSSDSYEYYQTEIFDQLPSIQASRAEQNRQGVLEPCEVYQGGPEPEEFSHGHWLRGPKDKASLQPLRNLPMCIEAKREARHRRKMRLSNIGFWESWLRSQSISRKRVWQQMGEALSGLLLWKRTLHIIEGRFGVGVKAYFVFLRYLIYLNLLHCALIGGFILGPTQFYGRGNSEPLIYGGNDSFLDFFMGSGYLSRSPVFFGFYSRGSLDLPCLNTPLLYLIGILTILFLSLIMVVRRTTVGYKHTWMVGKRYSMNMSYKIFCGWDFTIQDLNAASLKHSFIRNDLKLFLDEQCFALRKAQRTLGQKVRLNLLRFILNVLVLALLGGAFYLIYFATVTSLQEKRPSSLVTLFFQYLPPFTITLINLILPLIFRKITSFEDYSLTTQVNVTLVRSVFLKLSSLGIFLFFIFTSKEDSRTACRENVFGRELYKLYIFNFLTTFCNVLFVNYPRKLVQKKYPTSLLAQLLGKQRFLIPFNVLDLVNSQTVSWVGVYYCPLLPLIGTVTLVATLYIKKFMVLRCCVAEQRFFRASNSSVLFHFMLLLGLLMAASTLGFYLYQQVAVDNISPSLLSGTFCGPFGNGQNMFNVTRSCVDSLPAIAKTTLGYLVSEAFAMPVILAEIIILTSYVSRVRANHSAIERLKDMLIMSSSDKRFLVRQHATLFRCHKNTHRVGPEATEENLFHSHCKDPPSQHAN
ncbi:Transmembrane channel-like protein 7 [Channa argus]|uniref:Transmembrane channel-like protein n=1 Tax=Channa argus TaxID=215402 RepID=A0A6G1PAJ9_CHAAH|nr:Transmembrane channel-like protein 7 [Channa argus]